MRSLTWMSCFTALALAVTPACVGQAPGGPGGDDTGDDAPPDANPDPSPNPKVSGMTMDYFTGLALSNVALTTDGLTPPVTSTSSPQGEFQLADVLPGSVFYVHATRPNSRPTRNDMIRVLDTDATANLWVVSIADANRQYATLGLTATLGTAVTFVDLRRNNGQPLEGIPLADVKLVDALGEPVGIGPYFFGAAGDVDANVLVSTAYGTPPRARAAFLDVPLGTYTLLVDYLAGGGDGGGEPELRTFEVSVVTVADGATLASTGGQDDDGMNPGTPRFAIDIHPMLQRGADGGLGCANCHTAAGTMPALQFDLPATEALAAILGRPGVVDLASPAESMLLTKPLYEPPPLPQDHPNATFPNTQDPGYRMILRWIQGGAQP